MKTLIAFQENHIVWKFSSTNYNYPAFYSKCRKHLFYLVTTWNMLQETPSCFLKTSQHQEWSQTLINMFFSDAFNQFYLQICSIEYMFERIHFLIYLSTLYKRLESYPGFFCYSQTCTETKEKRKKSRSKERALRKYKHLECSAARIALKQINSHKASHVSHE